MFASVFIRIVRKWQAERKLIALAIQSHGKHTEASVLLDDTGSAYQITVHGFGFYFRPTISTSEYLPDTMRVIQQRSTATTLFCLRRDLERAFLRVEGWIDENKGRRLPEEEEMKLVQVMFAKAKKSDSDRPMH